MRASKNKLNPKVERRFFETFYQLLADFQKKEETEIFLKNFLTRSELLTLSKRLAVSLMLEKGLSYAKIKERVKVSSATIASVAEMMQKKPKGFALALKRIEAEDWADKTAQKISNFFKNLSPVTNTSK